MDDQLKRGYALAIYDIAEENNKVNEYLENIVQLCDLIKNNLDLHNFIENPKVSNKRKADLFKTQFADQLDRDLLSFLLLLIEKDRLIHLNEILDEIKEIYLERHNQVTAIVKTVTALTSEQRENLIKKLEDKYNKKIILKAEVDKSIIGGIFIKVKDDIIDGTFKTKYEELRALMLKR